MFIFMILFGTWIFYQTESFHDDPYRVVCLVTIDHTLCVWCIPFKQLIGRRFRNGITW